MEAQYTPQYSRHVCPTAGSLGGRENGKISQVNLMFYRGVNFNDKIIPPTFKILFLSGCMSVINIVVDPMSVNLNISNLTTFVNNYVKPVSRFSLTMFLNNYVKLEIKLINLTCII